MQTLSDLLGYVSIACWLCAQFPQVIKNMRLKSSEGIALPFLLNWLLADISNLVGCILTHQLPFQTWLAMYFIFIDTALLTQYFYYLRPKHLVHPSFGRARSRTSATIGRRSTDRPRYRTLSAVAANVAAAAALAAQQGDEADAQYAQSKRQRESLDRLLQGQGGHVASETAEEDPDENALATLADSFHSETWSPNRRKRISWSTERHGLRGGSVGRSARGTVFPSLQISVTESPVQHVDSSRGRPLQREGDVDAELEQESAGERRSSRASRRGAGMVFLGVWALFGFGTLVGRQRDFSSSSSTSMGRVLYPGTASMPVALPHGLIPRSPSLPVDDDLFFNPDDQPPEPQDPPPHVDPYPIEPPSSDRVLGRIFAWLCTTLYLTSRLPQIWKNFSRKSVEGLSMFLFIFAFFGNIFYVASILSSPKLSLPPPASTELIRETIPYLLGSSGTLVFDITIVAQSFIYRPRAHHHRGRQRVARTQSRMLGEEETGLLSGDALH